MGKDSNTLSLLVVSAHLADQSALEESVDHGQRFNLTLDRALVMLGHISQFHMSNVLDAEQMVDAGNIPMATAIKALRLAKERQQPFKQVLPTLGPEFLQTQQLPKASHPVLTLLTGAQILTKESGNEALQTRLKTGVQIGQILLSGRKVSSVALCGAITAAAWIKEGKITKEGAVEALKIVHDRTVSLEQALFELGKFREEPGGGVRIGELLLMSGVISEWNLLECMEISVVDDRDINSVFVEQGILERTMIEAAIVLQDKIDDGTTTAFLAAHALKQVYARGISIYEAMAELPQAPSEIPSIVDLLVASGAVTRKDMGASAPTSPDPIKVAKIMLTNKLATEEFIFAAIRCHCLLKEGCLSQEQAIELLKMCHEDQIGLNAALASFKWQVPNRKQWAWKHKSEEEQQAPPPPAAKPVESPRPQQAPRPQEAPAPLKEPEPKPAAPPPADLNVTQQRLKSISQLKTTQHAAKVMKPAVKFERKDISNDAHANEVLKKSWILRQYLKYPIALWLPIIIFAAISVGDLYTAKFRHAAVAPLATIGQEYVLEDYSRSVQFDAYGNATLKGADKESTVPYETLRPGWSECLGLIDSYSPGRIWLASRGTTLLLTDGNFAYSGNADERTMMAAMIAFGKALDRTLSKKERFVKTLADLGDADLSYTLSDGEKREPEMVRQNLKEDSLSVESLINALAQMDAKTLNDCVIAGNQVKAEIKPNAIVAINFKGVAKVNRLSVILAADKDGNLLRRKSSAQNLISYCNGFGVQEPGSKAMSRELAPDCQKFMISSLTKPQALRLYGLIALGVALYIVFQRAARYSLIHNLEEQTGIRGQHNFIKRWFLDRRVGFARITMFVYCAYVAVVIYLYVMR